MHYSFLHLRRFDRHLMVRRTTSSMDRRLLLVTKRHWSPRAAGFSLQSWYSSTHIEPIANIHKALIHVYQKAPFLKHVIDALIRNSSFTTSWNLLGARFPNLIKHCGIVATLFLGTNTTESVFFVLHWEKDMFHQALYDFGLEGGYGKEAISHDSTTTLIIE